MAVIAESYFPEGSSRERLPSEDLMTLKALAVFLSLTLAAASQALPLIRERATSPGCYEHANTALLGALRAVENKARVKCGGAYPVLQGVQVEVKRVGGCTPVTVTGSYLCGGR
jgi:hypothetical protein